MRHRSFSGRGVVGGSSGEVRIGQASARAVHDPFRHRLVDFETAAVVDVGVLDEVAA